MSEFDETYKILCEIEGIDRILSDEVLDDETALRWADELNNKDSDLSAILRYIKEHTPDSIGMLPTGVAMCLLYGQEAYEYGEPSFSIQAPNLKGRFLDIRWISTDSGDRFTSISLVEPVSSDSKGSLLLIELLNDMEVISWEMGLPNGSRRLTRGDMMEFDGIIGDIKNELLPTRSGR